MFLGFLGQISIRTAQVQRFNRVLLSCALYTASNFCLLLLALRIIIIIHSISEIPHERQRQRREHSHAYGCEPGTQTELHEV